MKPLCGAGRITYKRPNAGGRYAIERPIEMLSRCRCGHVASLAACCGKAVEKLSRCRCDAVDSSKRRDAVERPFR